MAHRKARQDAGETVDLHVVGKKGIGYLRFLRVETASRRPGMEDKPRYDEVDAVGQGFIDQYARQELDAVHVAYMRFYSAGRQRPELLQLLPIPRESEAPPAAGPAPTENVQYEFSPEPRLLLGELLPASVKVRLFQCFMDAAVSEQVARMTAMKAATDAARDTIKLLTRQYNRARQTRITMELLDILGGVEALKG
jgi:F-type H+-transporting ATPase subunit gamma